MHICYINITKHIPARDVIYLNGLKKNGVNIMHIQDSSPHLRKIWIILTALWNARNKYDVLWVGYSGHILVPFARLVSRKPIIFNCLGSLYEGTIVTRKRFGLLGWRAMYCWFIDFLAFNAASMSMVESYIQKEYIVNKFFISPKKLEVYWTGVDDTQFRYDPSISKLPIFTVVFRGNLQPGCGIGTLLIAARELRDQNINFIIIGTGILENEIAAMIDKLRLPNVEWMRNRYAPEFLSSIMQGCHLSLGWLDAEDRATRTIPHKIFESLAIRVPCLTGRQRGVMELLQENETIFYFRPGDPADLAARIRHLQQNPELRAYVADSAYKLYDKQLRQEILARRLLHQIQTQMLGVNT